MPVAALLACAAPAGARNVQASVNNYAQLPDGFGLVDTTSVNLGYGLDLHGWNVAIDQAAALNQQSVGSAPRVSYRGLGRSPKRVSGLRDLRVSATRTVGIGRGIKLDFLARATLPTGKPHVLLGGGRTEVLLDAGLRRDVAGATVWLGAARRFRKTSLMSTGRDINEFYAGAIRPIDDQSNVRLDYLLGQSEVAGGRLTRNLSFGYTRDLDGLGSIEFNASSYRDAFVESSQGLLSVRVPTDTIF
jgi:hypothetical protein